MSKKLISKELKKLELQMDIPKVNHDRPSVGRSTIFYGKTNKNIRTEGKKIIRDWND